MQNNILVVGAGFSGAVIARELAEAGFTVTVIDRRGHIAGNAFDCVNEFGIRIHKYGPHLFHTSNQGVVDWLSRFTEWVHYKHRVKALLKDGRLVTFPVNQETAKIVGPENVLDIFYRPYTRKMWGMELDDLNPEIANRVPIRKDLNELYFPDDTFQALPKEGYTKLIENILSHSNIKLALNTEFSKNMEASFFHVFNSMSIDEYFDYRFGRLPYRSIKFHSFDLPIPSVIPVVSVNFTHEEPFTRMTEWKNLPGHGAPSGHTTITIEEPCDPSENHGERFYPIKDQAGHNKDLYQRYESIKTDKITFIGRCGLYAYLDMHQAVSSSLAIARRFLNSTAAKDLGAPEIAQLGPINIKSEGSSVTFKQ